MKRTRMFSLKDYSNFNQTDDSTQLTLRLDAGNYHTFSAALGLDISVFTIRVSLTKDNKIIITNVLVDGR